MFAETKVSSSVRYLSSARIPAHSWAYLGVTVKNKGDKTDQVKLIFSPKGQRNITIWEINLTIPPHTQYRHEEMVTIGSTESLNTKTYINGHLVSTVSSSESVIRLKDRNDQTILFFEDNDEPSFGVFSKNNGFGVPVVNTSCRAANAPYHVAGYDNIKLVIICQPDFSSMRSRQFNALLDYVNRGGTLLFAEPKGTLAAWNTPLRKLIPVTPLRIRKLEKITSLKDFKANEEVWPKGTDFLESLPRHGRTVLKHDDFPVFQWSRYGSGRVGFSAFYISDRHLTKKNNPTFTALWRHVVSYRSNSKFVSSTENKKISMALDTITGIEIEPAEKIRKLIIVYMVIVLILAALGILLKKQSHCWGLMALIAVFMTGFIFQYSNKRMEKLGNANATIIEFKHESTEDASSEQLVSLIVSKEQKMDIYHDDMDYKMRALPPAKFSYNAKNFKRKLARGKKKSKMKNRRATFGDVERGKDEDFRDPMKLTYVDGKTQMLNVNMRNLKPHMFSTLRSYSPQNLSPQFATVKWALDGPQITANNIKFVKPKDIYLVCENGFFVLELDGQKITIRKKTEAIKTAEIKALRDYISSGNLSAPLIAVIRDTANSVDHSLIEKSYNIQARSISFYPVHETGLDEELSLPNQRISFKLKDVLSKQLISPLGDWLPVITNHPTNYIIDAYLPAGFSRMQIKKLTLEFLADNRLHNLNYKFFVQNWQSEKKLQFSKIGEHLYSLEVDDYDQLKEYIHPANGQLKVVISISQKTKVKDPVSAARMNKWTIRTINLAVSGKLKSPNMRIKEEMK
ncbi:MAG: hypothetical protein MJH11_00965 [Lentisphaeria bacterium]|nr:hypothetical protein [Lentisphaeria bacterium]